MWIEVSFDGTVLGHWILPANNYRHREVFLSPSNTVYFSYQSSPIDKQGHVAIGIDRFEGLREIVWVKSSVFGHPRCHGPLPARPPDPRRDFVREASCTRPRHFAVCGAVWIEAACVNRNQTGCQISGSMQVRTLSRKYSSSRIPSPRRWITRILLFRPSTKPSGTLFSGLQ